MARARWGSPEELAAAVGGTGAVLVALGACCALAFGGVGPAEAGWVLLALGGILVWIGGGEAAGAGTDLRRAWTRFLGGVAVYPVPATLLVGFVLGSLVAATIPVANLRETAHLVVLLALGPAAAAAWRIPKVRRLGTGVLFWGLLANLAWAALGTLLPGLWQGWRGDPFAAPWLSPGASPVSEAVSGLTRSHLQYGLLLCLGAPFALEALRRRLPGRFWLAAACLWFVCGFTVVPPHVLGILFLEAILFLRALRARDRTAFPTAGFLVAGLALLLGAVARPRTSEQPGAWEYLQPLTVTADGRTAPKRLTVEAAAAIARAPCRLYGYGPGTYRDAIRTATAEAGFEKPMQNRVRPDGNPQVLVTLVECGLPAACCLLWFLFGAAGSGRRMPAADPEAHGLPYTAALQASLAGLAGMAGVATAVFSRGIGPLAVLLAFRGWSGRLPAAPRRLAGGVTSRAAARALLLGGAVLGGVVLRGCAGQEAAPT
ncbi:MAG: hypothetical protein JXR77_12175, partial [Lentisphaeria bacterium]|nr:hypothetical protein [Lentisphaeria bacterium]